MKFQNCIWRGNPLMRMMPLQKPNDDDNDGKLVILGYYIQNPRCSQPSSKNRVNSTKK